MVRVCVVSEGGQVSQRRDFQMEGQAWLVLKFKGVLCGWLVGVENIPHKSPIKY